MERDKMINIPGRLHSVASEGQALGADEVYDDTLMMSQADINAIVIGGSVSVGLSASPSPVFVGEQREITLKATSSVGADIIIKEGDNVVATGEGTSLTGSSTITPTSAGNTNYSAEFVVGGLTKNASAVVTAVYPIWYGSGNAWTSAQTKASAKTSPAGSYNVVVTTAASYVWFVVPASMSIEHATKSGFDFPLEAPQSVTKDGVAYKAYRSSNTYDAGTETIILY